MIEISVALGIAFSGIVVAGSRTFNMLDANGTSRYTLQAMHLAEEGLDYIESQIGTNRIRFADDGCWDTTETTDICDSAISPEVFAAIGETKYYALTFDHVDFTQSVVGPLTASGEFSDSAVLSRFANGYSVYRKYLSPDQSKPVLSGNSPDAVLTSYYRQITVKAVQIDSNDDGVDEKALLATSTVKFAYHLKVKTYQVSTLFTNDR